MAFDAIRAKNGLVWQLGKKKRFLRTIFLRTDCCLSLTGGKFGTTPHTFGLIWSVACYGLFLQGVTNERRLELAVDMSIQISTWQ